MTIPDYNSLTMEQKHFVDKLVKDFNMTQEESIRWIVDNGLTEPEMLKG